MTRTRKITTIEEQPDENEQTPVAVPIEQEQHEAVELSVSERIAEIKARGELDECISRVYEITGTKTREFIAKVDDLIEEDYLAENFGPGKYAVLYTYKSEGVRKQTSQNFAVSSAYKGAKNASPVLASAQPQNGLLAGLLGNMTAAEKVTAAVALIEGVKKIFAPPPPPVDLTELLKVIAANRAPALGDAVIMKAMEMNRPAPVPAPSILEQIKQLNEVKELLKTEENAESGGDNMNFFIEQGLKLLPALLQKNGGSYQAAGAAVKDNPIITGLIQNDPELAGQFINAAAEKYGTEAAKQLAAGFGYSFEPATPEQIETPQQITTQDGSLQAPAKG